MKKINLFMCTILISIVASSSVFAVEYTGAVYWAERGYSDPPYSPSVAINPLVAGDTAENILSGLNYYGSVQNYQGGASYYRPYCKQWTVNELVNNGNEYCTERYLRWAVQRTITCLDGQIPSSDYYSCVATLPNIPPVTPIAKMNGDPYDCLSGVGGN